MQCKPLQPLPCAIVSNAQLIGPKWKAGLQRLTSKVGIAAIRKTLRQKPTIAAIEARIHPAPGATRPVAFGMRALAGAGDDQLCRAPGNLGSALSQRQLVSGSLKLAKSTPDLNGPPDTMPPESKQGLSLFPALEDWLRESTSEARRSLKTARSGSRRQA